MAAVCVTIDGLNKISLLSSHFLLLPLFSYHSIVCSLAWVDTMLTNSFLIRILLGSSVYELGQLVKNDTRMPIWTVVVLTLS